EPALRAGLRLCRRAFAAGRTSARAATRHPAVDSGVELPARRDAGHGGAVPPAAIGYRVGFDPADLHWASLGHCLQLLQLAEVHPARTRRRRARLPLQPLAT